MTIAVKGGMSLKGYREGIINIYICASDEAEED